MYGREELYTIDGAVCTHGKDYLNKAKADKVKELEGVIQLTEKHAGYYAGRIKELAPAVIELNRMNEELQAEIELLKGEIKVLHTECDTCWKVEKLRKENERLNKEIGLYEENTEQQGKMLEAKSEENAKLKCLALHSMREYFKAMSALNTWREEYYGEAKYLHRVICYDKPTSPYDNAYRKAMLALMEGK